MSSEVECAVETLLLKWIQHKQGDNFVRDKFEDEKFERDKFERDKF